MIVMSIENAAKKYGNASCFEICVSDRAD